MSSRRPVRTILRWEQGQSLRSYWFLANAGIFLAGGLLLMLLGQPEASVLGYRGFGRALAALAQLALFFVPLMALFPATAALAGERELGTLDYLLAQPVTRGQVFAGKWCGVASAMALSLAIAFGVTGGVAAVRGVPTGLVLALLGLTLLLATAFVSVGLWISAGTGSRGQATSVGVTLWLVFLALGSLGLMAAFVRWGLPAVALQTWALVNPVEAYRMAALVVLGPEAELLGLLGPVGSALVERWGRGGLATVAAASLACWSTVAYAAGRRRFGRTAGRG